MTTEDITKAVFATPGDLSTQKSIPPLMKQDRRTEPETEALHSTSWKKSPTPCADARSVVSVPKTPRPIKLLTRSEAASYKIGVEGLKNEV